MKIFVAFLFVHLIAGILCSEATKAKNALRSDIVVTSYIDRLSALRLTRLDYLCKAVKQAVIDKCKKNGGPKAFDDANESLRSVQNLIDSFINDTMNHVRLVGLQSWNGQEQIPRLCDTYMTVMNSTMLALNSVGPCLDEAERATANIMFNVFIAEADSFCRNNGSNLISFYTAGGFECIANLSWSDCSVQMPPRDIPVLTDVVELIGIPWSYGPSLPSLDECRHIRTAKICIAERLSGCEQPELASLMNSAYAAMEKAAGCENILDAGASSAA